jgi:DNA-binding YbaB/EbfC family protein
MSSPNIGDMLKQAQQVQARFGELQRELATRRFEASSGGGMVKAVVSGQLRVLGVEIEPSLVSGGDRDMIQDLCAAAVNAAIEKAQRGVQEEFQRLQSSMGMPGPGGGAGPG